MSDEQRAFTRAVIGELYAHNEKVLGMSPEAHAASHQTLSEMAPFIVSQKAAYDAKAKFYEDLGSALGLETRKKRLRALLGVLGVLGVLVIFGKDAAIKLMTSIFGG